MVGQTKGSHKDFVSRKIMDSSICGARKNPSPVYHRKTKQLVFQDLTSPDFVITFQ